MKSYSHTYSKEEVNSSDGSTCYEDVFDDKSTELFYIYGDVVKVFNHMLDGLIYLSDILESEIENDPNKAGQAAELLVRLNDEILYIQQNKEDRPPALLMKILGEENVLEIDCGGYWKEFVETSYPYWDHWIENFVSLRSEAIYWENRKNDRIAHDYDDNDLDDDDEGEEKARIKSTSELIEDDDEMNYVENNMGSIPDDIEDPDFVYHLISILPD